MLEKIARFKPGENISVVATVANGQLSAARFVEVTGKDSRGSYEGKHAAAGTERPFGVTQRSSADPAAEDAASVDLLVECVRSNSVPWVEAGEAIVAPCDIAVGANGKAVNADAAVAASLVTGTVGENNAIKYVAKTPGAAADALTVELLNTGKEKALSVNVDGSKIIVTLATNGTGAGEITSTAAEVIAAIEAHDTASQLVAVSNSGSSSGAGKVKAVATTHLAGGADSTGGALAVGKALTSAEEAGDFIEVDLY